MEFMDLNGARTFLNKLREEFSAHSFKSLSVSGNTVSFFTSNDGTGTAAASFDFPEEIFLDQTGTSLVENFAWSAASYPGSTNPNLDGKTVLVLAVKGDKETNPTAKFSFVNLEKLIDVYTAADNSINISGYTVAVNISAIANNAITLQNDGLHVDISGKVDKVANPTSGNIAALANDGNIADSGVATDDVVTKVAGATAGNVVTFDANGKIADSGLKVASLQDFTDYLDSIFPVN